MASIESRTDYFANDVIRASVCSGSSQSSYSWERCEGNQHIFNDADWAESESDLFNVR